MIDLRKPIIYTREELEKHFKVIKEIKHEISEYNSVNIQLNGNPFCCYICGSEFIQSYHIRCKQESPTILRGSSYIFPLCNSKYH